MSGDSAVGTELEVRVERVAHGGACVGRADGRVVFVRHALPGERLRVVVTDDRGRFLRADPVAVLDASPDRVPPPCPHAGPGRCGGCDFQHAALPAQRRLKAQVVREQLARLAGLDRPVEVEAVPGADDGLGWRTRVRFAVREDGVVGLRRHRSHEVEPLDACPLAHPEVEAVGVERRRWPDAEQVEVVAGSGGDRAVVVTPRRRGGAVGTPPLDAGAAVLRAERGGRVRPVRGRAAVRERAAGRQWRVTGSGFWQVHPAAADALVVAVLEALAPRAGESALDLYAGVGLFAGAVGERVGPGGRVTAVEADRGAADDAAHNLADLPWVRVVADRVERGIAGLRRADLVVLDPPRSGAGARVVRRLAQLRSRAICYVACDPATLARDLATFADTGWSLHRLRAFDLFPMTAHVECVALLTPA